MDDAHTTLTATVIVITFVVSLFFCISLWGLVKKIPRENQQFPTWFVWLILIPWFGFIFQCILLPFGIPNAIKKTYSNNQEIIAYAELLFKVGLATVVLGLLGVLLRFHPLNDIAGGISIALWITYWVMIVRFKYKYLKNDQ